MTADTAMRAPVMPIDRVWWRLARSPSIANAPGASTPAASP